MERSRIARVVAVCGVLAMLGACTASKVDPDAAIDLGGSVSRQDGTVVAGARVALVKEPDLSELFTTFATVGLACLDEELPSACRGARITETGDDGTFRFELTGRDTQGTGRTASTLELSSGLARARDQLEGPAATTGFIVQTERVRVPLRFWEPRVTAVGDARSARVRWSAVPGDIVPEGVSMAALRTGVRFQQANQLVWEYEDVRSNQRLDARLLEDSRGSMAVLARLDDAAVAESAGSRLAMTLRSARYPYASRGVAPVSRGRPCFAYDARRRPVAQASCALTDGEFSRAFEPRTTAPCQPRDDPARCAEPQHARAYIDLGSARRVSMVVLRSCDAPCSVETSRDARSWRLAGTGGSGPDDGIALRLGEPVRARYVRVSAQSGVGGITEVSVWDATTARGARGSLLTGLGSGRASDAEGLGGSSPPKRKAIWGAILLLLVAGAVVAVALRARVRRRSAR